MDTINCYEDGFHPKFNQYFPDIGEPKFEFLKRPIQSLAFKVVYGIIFDIVLYLNVLEIVNFYYNLEDVYGKAGGARISSRYLQKHGYLTPPNLGDSITANAYNDLPHPEVMDYKDLNDVSWDGFDTKLTDKDVFLHVRNSQNREKSDDEFYLVEVKFSIYRPLGD